MRVFYASTEDLAAIVRLRGDNSQLGKQFICTNQLGVMNGSSDKESVIRDTSRLASACLEYFLIRVASGGVLTPHSIFENVEYDVE